MGLHAGCRTENEVGRDELDKESCELITDGLWPSWGLRFTFEDSEGDGVFHSHGRDSVGGENRSSEPT